MKRGILYVLLLVGLMFALGGQVFAAQSVTAVGRAEIVGSNKDGARSNALANAFREAVEKGIGVWVQSHTEVKDAALVRDQILTRAQGYVTDHEIVKEKVEDNILVLTIRANVAVDKIGADIKSLVGRVSTAMGNPSITFVLTTWEKRGQQGSASRIDAVDVSVKADAKTKYDVADDSSAKESASASVRSREKSSSDASLSTQEQAAITAQGKSSQRSAGSASGRVAVGGQYVEGDGYAAGSVGYAASGQQSSAESGNMSASGKSAYDGAAKAQSSERYGADMKANASQASSTRSKGHNDASVAVDTSTKVKQDSSYSKIDEDLWKKYPDMTIIDSFQQEFLAKNFDLMAADKARQIAVSTSLAQTSVDPNDRQAVRDFATKEGAGFVARGEVKVLGFGVSEATGNQEVKTQIGVEIIDVNSGDVVGSFTNTATATSSNFDEAKMQSIKKNAVLASRTLAGQTIDVWQKRSLNGRQYSIEIRNVKSVRSQQLPILSAIKGIAQITNQANPDKATLLVKVMYKGDKESLGSGIIEAVGSKPGFSEAEFDGPGNEDGKIVFTFKK
jgi:hypothetical protein